MSSTLGFAGLGDGDAEMVEADAGALELLEVLVEEAGPGEGSGWSKCILLMLGAGGSAVPGAGVKDPLATGGAEEPAPLGLKELLDEGDAPRSSRHDPPVEIGISSTKVVTAWYSEPGL